MRKRTDEKTKIIMAFRKYTRLGLASETLSPFLAYRRIRGVSRTEEEAYDLLAVYDTVRILKLLNRKEELYAVRDIYFADKNILQRRNTVSMRVLRHAYEMNCDERTVYRQLEFARKLYSNLRKSY